MYNVGISELCRVLVYSEGKNALNPCSVTPELLSEKAIGYCQCSAVNKVFYPAWLS